MPVRGESLKAMDVFVYMICKADWWVIPEVVDGLLASLQEATILKDVTGIIDIRMQRRNFDLVRIKGTPHLEVVHPTSYSEIVFVALLHPIRHGQSNARI